MWSYELEGNGDVDWGVGFPSNPKAGGLSDNGSCFYSSMTTNTGDKTPPFLTLGFILLISVEQDLQTFFFRHRFISDGTKRKA
ncbi:MAG: hypothetical protein IPI53_18050 [Saprospiraceae bacterium]|nr:hypothetical protein [Saprospiraceae bacterium]